MVYAVTQTHTSPFQTAATPFPRVNPCVPWLHQTSYNEIEHLLGRISTESIFRLYSCHFCGTCSEDKSITISFLTSKLKPIFLKYAEQNLAACISLTVWTLPTRDSDFNKSRWSLGHRHKTSKKLPRRSPHSSWLGIMLCGCNSVSQTSCSIPRGTY